MDPDGNKPKPLKPVTRWLVIPVAFSWLGFLLCAPFALVDEGIAAWGILVGLVVGFGVAAMNPRWMKVDDVRNEAIDVAPLPPAPRSLGRSLMLTTLAATFAWVIVWALQQASDEKGLLFFVAAFFMISAVRRLLRQAWGLYGSMVGMLSSGVLLVLLVRSTSDEPENQQLMTWLVAVPFVIVEAWDEVRGLKRMERSSRDRDT